jgi:hypothetical protein
VMARRPSTISLIPRGLTPEARPSAPRIRTRRTDCRALPLRPCRSASYFPAHTTPTRGFRDSGPVSQRIGCGRRNR